MVSDNAKTFKSAAKTIHAILNSSEVQQYSLGIGMGWVFNLERAPWWGGIFKRMIKSTKRCLRKIIGQVRFTYNELMIAFAEVEMVLNSRSLLLSIPDAAFH